jgi:glycine/D-amino acid oxidase-like deaminating enzyme
MLRHYSKLPKLRAATTGLIPKKKPPAHLHRNIRGSTNCYYSKAIVPSMNSPSNMHGYPCLSVLAFTNMRTAASIPPYPSQWKVQSIAPTRDLRLERSFFGVRHFSTTALFNSQEQAQEQDQPIRIGIVGGGIAGVTVAHSLARRLPTTTAGKNAEIVVLEGDIQKSVPGLPPAWKAATARNANSLVPGAAMHVFSRQNVLWDVIRDTLKDWYLQHRDTVRGLLPASSKVGQAGLVPLEDENELFHTPPPYFALHLMRCLGPSADSVERMSFVRFLSQFLYSALWLGDKAADERGHVMCRLAQANRAAYLEAVHDNAELQAQLGHSQGFISIHRSLAKAQHAVAESKAHGEDAALLEWEDALEAEPRLRNLPMKDQLYAVQRPNDYTASCEAFVRHWIDESTTMGVQYLSGKVDRLEVIETAKPTDKKFRVTTADKSVQEFDLLILAGGVTTPLMAAQLGVGQYCPTYPLRGFSFSLFAPTHDKTAVETKTNKSEERSGNLSHQPFSVDSMYWTSVSPIMLRTAGFGEFVGYRDKAESVQSLGPSVLTRYARKIVPEAWNARAEEALPCFRPQSPDDLPLVGEVPSMPGLFLHNGHGTLGWTTGLATGDCVAQAVADRLEGRSSQDGVFTLADNTQIERKTLSPGRFISRINI